MTDRKKITHYLVVDKLCTDLVDLDGLIDRAVGDDGSIKAMYLVTPDEAPAEVTVHDVGDEASIEFEVHNEDDHGKLVESVCYDGPNSTSVVSHTVHVDGFEGLPGSGG